VASPPTRLSRSPPYLVQAHGVLEALEHDLAAVGVDVGLAGEQVPRRLRDEDSPTSAFAAMRDAMITVGPRRSPSSSIDALPDMVEAVRLVLDIGEGAAKASLRETVRQIDGTWKIVALAKPE
jgi:hypothetical protein